MWQHSFLFWFNNKEIYLCFRIMLKKRFAVIWKILAFHCNGKEIVNYIQLPQDLRINRSLLYMKTIRFRRSTCVSYFFFIISFRNRRTKIIIIIIARFHLCVFRALIYFYWVRIPSMSNECGNFSFGILRPHCSSKSLARKYPKSEIIYEQWTTNIHYTLYHFTMMRI